MRVFGVLVTLAVYFGGIVVMFGSKLLNLLHTHLVLGILLFLVWTLLMLVVLLAVLQTVRVTQPMLEAKPKTKLEELQDVCNKTIGVAGKAVNPGLTSPFKADLSDDIKLGATGILEKYRNILHLLDDQFSPEDVTYATYKESLDSVVDIAIANMNAMTKRMRMFDYRGYAENPQKQIYQDYRSEVEEACGQNLFIDEKLDTLTHELISLDDPSNASLGDLTSLIDQVKKYNK